MPIFPNTCVTPAFAVSPCFPLARLCLDQYQMGIMTSESITIFVGKWNDREFVFSLSMEQAKLLVEGHFAFGDPSTEEYAFGNVWASESQRTGWRIEERKVEVRVISVEVQSTQPGETAHVLWQCPCCKRFYSDDWGPDEELPVLLLCPCESESNFLLGVASSACS